MARGATLAARCFYEPQIISIHPAGLGFLHAAERYRPGGSAFTSSGSWNCRGMEVFLTREWELILPGCGGTTALAEGATFAARWFHEPQPISNHPLDLRFPHPAGRYRPGGSACSSPGYWSRRDMEGFLTRGWEISSPGVAGLRRLPEGQLSARAGSMSPSQSTIIQWGWGFRILRGGIDPGDVRFRPRVDGVVEI